MALLETLNKSVAIKNNSNPVTTSVAPTRVNGIEKYPVSLYIITTLDAKYIPINIVIIPGIQIYFNGDFIAIFSKIVVMTSPVCEIGFFVDV